jgi:MOSC domain-containing protein YiiM
VRIETVAVGGPRGLSWNGREVSTSIFKSPVSGPVAVRRHNVDGDRQSDLSVHGGEYKAVYAYAAEHYDWWKTVLGRDLEPANFGENLTIRGLSEGPVNVGDVFRMGSADLEATAPRLPCFKLGLRFGNVRMVRAFADSRRYGVYFRVVTEGELEAGAPVERIHADSEGIPVSEIARVTLFDRSDVAMQERLAGHERLDPSWRTHFREKLKNASRQRA